MSAGYLMNLTEGKIISLGLLLGSDFSAHFW